MSYTLAPQLQVVDITYSEQIAEEARSMVRETASKFIGKANTPETRAEIADALTSLPFFDSLGKAVRVIRERRGR